MKRLFIFGLILAANCFGQGLIVDVNLSNEAAAGGGGPTTLFSDTYTVGDTTTLGANYTESSGNTTITGNRIRLDNNGPGVVITTTTAHADTADVTVSVTHATTGADGGPVVRCTDGDATPTMYAVDVFGTEIHIYRHVNSASGTEIGTGATVTMVANAVTKLEVSGVGATVTLKAYYNGALVINTTDTSGSRLVTAGRTGIYNWVAQGVNSDWDNLIVTTP